LTGKLIRPVVDSGPLERSHTCIVGLEREILPFDIVVFDFHGDKRVFGQPENVLFETARPFRKIPSVFESMRTVHLEVHLSQGSDLLGLGGMRGDRISHDELIKNGTSESLALIRVIDPEFQEVPQEGRPPRLRMSFRHGDSHHSLMVTAKNFAWRTHPAGEWIICVSRAEKKLRDGFHYGVVAMAIPLAEVSTYFEFRRNDTASRLQHELNRWRREKIRKHGKEVLLLFSDAILETIVERRPTAMEDLRHVCGINETIGETFLDEILEIVRTCK
jgi:hypothetical protein